MKSTKQFTFILQRHNPLSLEALHRESFKQVTEKAVQLVVVATLVSGCASVQATTEKTSVVPTIEKEAAPVTAAAKDIQELAAETFEQDRKAILAFAGKYEVTFQYMETAGMREGYTPKDPYSAQGTEFVEVVEDSGRKIDLQHVLVMPSEDGDESRVVKHWRQTWTYQDDTVYEYVGNRSWLPRKFPPQEVVGTWTQAVYQVDDSPRYESIGRWSHKKNFSSWESAETWRPLPRREYTKRSDYHVLVARNRHTLTATGWLHEQDNYKLDLEAKEQQIIALEAGLNTYNRTDSVDFTAGYEYWEKTKVFWSDVRNAWAQVMDGQSKIHLRKEVDGKLLWKHIFGIASDVEENGYNAEQVQKEIHTTLKAFIIPASEAVAQGEGY